MDSHAFYPNSTDSFAKAIQLFATSQCILGYCFKASDYIPDGRVFDYIIVGAGSAGCVLANRLSHDPNNKVLLIDAGGDPLPESLIPGFWSSLRYTKYDCNLTSENDHISSQESKNSKIRITAAKMLGGGSSLNAMVFLRGNARDYNLWEESGNKGWGFRNLLHYFKKCENVTQHNGINKNFYRGTKGPIKTTKFDSKSYIDEFYRVGFNQFGIANNDDLNGPDQMGTASYEANTFNGIRQSSAIAYLHPVQNRHNLFILKHTLVTKILIDTNSRKAIGVKCESIMGLCNYFVEKLKGEIILSAGALRTPHLLMLSGIGPEKHLKELNIEVVANLSVGKNLHDHGFVPFFFISGRIPPEPTNEAPTKYAEYFHNRTGSLAVSSEIQRTTFYSLENNSYPDVQIMNIFLTRNTSSASFCEKFGFKSSFCDQLDKTLLERDILGFRISLLNKKSRGEVLLRSTNPRDYPKIFLGFGSDSRDMDKMAEIMSHFLKIVDTPEYRKQNAGIDSYDIETCRDFQIFTYEYFRCYYLNMITCSHHFVGTAKMGPITDENSVIDDELRIYTLNNLRVVDASIIPSIVSSNTNNPVMAIAENAADIILKHRLEKKRKCDN